MKSEIYLEHANFTVSNLFESVTTREQNMKCGLENILEILMAMNLSIQITSWMINCPEAHV